MDNTSEQTNAPSPDTLEQLQGKVVRLTRVVGVMAVILTASVVGSVVYVTNLLQAMQGDIDARPPLAIIDVNSIVMDELSKNRRMSADEAAVSAYKVGEVLAEKGYVVIHKSSIVAYPAEYEVAQ
jgi:hypothetical protein